MRVIFLGGASGVGASCLAVELAGRWALVDAGVRLDQAADPLPDLAALDGRDLAAVFVTHAHADHIGALPLVHQAFPAAPIYASLATIRLMEVMLADAVKIMARRAAEEMHVPLYDERLVAGMLDRLRPLPMGGQATVGELPGVTVHLSRAGHIAGAVSLGLEAADGRLVVSGDVSLTPQRTILGAAIPSLRRPDLLVLESTYGARLHPNRQAEELRLAQAVAEGVQRGHVLIPAFALGRAQEIILILRAAQRDGQIPEFPIWVDGLVRKVCAAYAAIPEALTPALRSHLLHGGKPFFGRNVYPVQNLADRERIIAGAPCCIISSSGMLTGGPSAWYAARLADRAEASILITGYQDEESPGRRLLDLAAAQEDATGAAPMLDLGGQTAPMRCRVGRYSLSAHADGGELAGLVGALQPHTVALVHGDADARMALAAKLRDQAEVLLPQDGETLMVRAVGRGRRKSQETPSTGDAPQSLCIGGGAPLDAAGLERLWQALDADVDARAFSLRELARAWYGDQADATGEALIAALLDHDRRWFAPVPFAEGLYALRPSAERWTPAALVGQLILVRDQQERLLPAVCMEVYRTGARVLPSAGEGQRPRVVPLSAVCEVVGPWSMEIREHDLAAAPHNLAELVKAGRRWRWQRGARALASLMAPDAIYDLASITMMADIPEDDLAGRLAVALTLNEADALFARLENDSAPGHPARYCLRPDWEAALASGQGQERPDQTWIIGVLEQHLGAPPDLYRRGVDPDTGAVTLYFHFPAVASKHYAAALASAAAEAGVEVRIYPQPHQGMLASAALAVAPPGLRPTRAPSLLLDHQTLRLICAGEASEAEIATAAKRFVAQTGWRLEIATRDGTPTEVAAPIGASERIDLNAARQVAMELLGTDAGCYKIGADQSLGALVLRFHFPDIARTQFAEQIAAITARTGWQARIYPEPHQGALEARARQALPAGLTASGAPSLHRAERTVVLSYQGSAPEEELQAAETSFATATGWRLVLRSKTC